MMMKLTSATLALLLAATHQTSVFAQPGCSGNMCQLDVGQFQACTNSSYYFQTIDESGGGFYTCAPYPGAPLGTNPPANNVASSSVVTDPGLNGWDCYPEGAAECPPGYAISELCSSSAISSNPMCTEYCTTPGYFAMKCIPTPTGYAPLGLGNWLPSTGGYESADCGTDSVMCGLCLSSNPSDCQGMNARAMCCSPGANNITGSWVYRYEVTANIHVTNQLQWGTQKTVAETDTSQWSDSITASVSAGFTILGVQASATVSGAYAQQYGKQYSNTWSTSSLETFGISFTSDQEGETFWVWQWHFDIIDSFGNNLNTMTQQYALTKGMELPPQCQPGYNIDEFYQTCDANFYLPGYNTTRRNLRAGSLKN